MKEYPLYVIDSVAVINIITIVRDKIDCNAELASYLNQLATDTIVGALKVAEKKGIQETLLSIERMKVEVQHDF